MNLEKKKKPSLNLWEWVYNKLFIIFSTLFIFLLYFCIDFYQKPDYQTSAEVRLWFNPSAICIVSLLRVLLLRAHQSLEDVYLFYEALPTHPPRWYTPAIISNKIKPTKATPSTQILTLLSWMLISRPRMDISI